MTYFLINSNKSIKEIDLAAKDFLCPFFVKVGPNFVRSDKMMFKKNKV